VTWMCPLRSSGGSDVRLELRLYRKLDGLLWSELCGAPLCESRVGVPGISGGSIPVLVVGDATTISSVESVCEDSRIIDPSVSSDSTWSNVLRPSPSKPVGFAASWLGRSVEEGDV